MDYHILKNQKNKRKLSSIFWRERKAKPIFKKAKTSSVDPREFYEKYGIIYNNSIEFSCVSSLF